MHALNFHEPYLRAILGFIGITDVSFVQGFAMDVPQYRAAALEKGIADAGALAWDDGWQRFEVAA
jgi:FMN-dependent NADH-azoreductase